MGFLQNTAQYELVAKLTPQGRRKLATSSNTLITTFSLGDSDSYYVSLSGLTGGQVPAISGNGNGVDLSNGGANYILKSTLNYNATTDKKPVDPASISVTNSFEHVGYKTIQYSGNGITQNQINLNDTQTDTLTNLFYSFSLPTTAADFNTYTGLTSAQGGYLDTAYSGIAQTNILVIGIDVSQYSELIDGKSIKLEMETSASTYNIYGTYETKGSPLTTEDTAVVDSSSSVGKYGPNRTMLFSDTILKPNGGDATKSWATGYSQSKPFSVNGKERFNVTTNVNISAVADKPVGVAYLDKGFLVITEPTIVNSYNSTYSGATGTTITFDTVRNKVSQSITCIANRGEFGVSNNTTWSPGDTPRITEVGMFDSSNTLIAIGKLNKPYEKSTDDFVTFNITIEY
tara:strand:- start:2426 stop:3631 length:1206 start_codon:yes stop_codon:yes gene_type:complete